MRGQCAARTDREQRCKPACRATTEGGKGNDDQDEPRSEVSRKVVERESERYCADYPTQEMNQEWVVGSCHK